MLLKRIHHSAPQIYSYMNPDLLAQNTVIKINYRNKLHTKPPFMWSVFCTANNCVHDAAFSVHSRFRLAIYSRRQVMCVFQWGSPAKVEAFFF